MASTHKSRRSVLVTGCTKGSAGYALALEFASRGLRVFATGRSLSSLEELSEHGVETLMLDVTSSASIHALQKEIETRNGGKLDMLFNNAGSMYESPAIDQDPRRVRDMFNTNVFGVFDMVSAFMPLLLAARSDKSQPPTIINTASILAVIPYPFSAAYNSTKAAVASYSDTLRIELAPLGIKVVTLYMGVVSTGLSTPDGIMFDPASIYISAEAGAKKRSHEHQVSGMKADQFAKEVVGEILVKRPGPGQGEYVWKGMNAFLIWILNSLGLKKPIVDSVEKEIGFTKEVKRSIAERTVQSSVQK